MIQDVLLVQFFLVESHSLPPAEAILETRRRIRTARLVKNILAQVAHFAKNPRDFSRFSAGFLT